MISILARRVKYRVFSNKIYRSMRPKNVYPYFNNSYNEYNIHANLMVKSLRLIRKLKFRTKSNFNDYILY